MSEISKIKKRVTEFCHTLFWYKKTTRMVRPSRKKEYLPIGMSKYNKKVIVGYRPIIRGFYRVT